MTRRVAVMVRKGSGKIHWAGMEEDKVPAFGEAVPFQARTICPQHYFVTDEWVRVNPKAVRDDEMCHGCD